MKLTFKIDGCVSSQSVRGEEINHRNQVVLTFDEEDHKFKIGIMQPVYDKYLVEPFELDMDQLQIAINKIKKISEIE